MRAAGSLGRNASARRLTRDKTLLCLPPTRNKMVSARHSHDNESLFVPVPPTEEKQLFGPAPTRKKKRSQCFVQAPGTRTHGRKKNLFFFLRRHLHGTECFGPTRNENIFGVSGTTRKRHEVVLGATHHKCLMPGAWYSVPARTHKNKSLCLVLSTTTCVDVRTHGRKSLFAPAPGLRTHGRKKTSFVFGTGTCYSRTHGRRKGVVVPVPTREEKRLLWYRHHLHTRNDTRHDEACCFLYPHTQHDDLLFCTRTE